VPTPLENHPLKPAAGALAAAGLPLLLLYAATVSRDFGPIDSGELAVVCARLGVAHPTGYPLYTLLGRLAVLLLPVRPIMAVNLLSALVCAAAAVAAVFLAGELGLAGGSWIAWGAGLWLGTSRVFWDQATGNEVYGLHLLLVILLLWSAARMSSGRGRPHDLLLLAWILGLALAHHLSVVFLGPALVWAEWCYFRPLGRVRLPGREHPVSGWWLLLPAAGVFLLAWSVVLVLPLRAARGPVLDWGDPSSWAGFWRHILAAQYRVWLFESGSLWARNLGGYLASLPGRFSWVVLAAAPVGIGVLARDRRRILGLLALAWIFTVAWAASYDIHDLETYFLPADLVLVFWALFGAAGAIGLLFRRLELDDRRLKAAAGAVLVLGVAGLQAGLHFRQEDRRQDHFLRVHVQAMLAALPPGTILLSRHWDALVSPLIYLQEVEKVRPDLSVVDTELLRRPWYYGQLRRRDPALLAPLEDRVRAFLEQGRLFEAGKPYDNALIEARYRAVIQGIAELHRPGRPTAATSDIDPLRLDGCVPVPEGLAYVYRENPVDTPRLAPPDPALLLRSGYQPQDDTHREVVAIWRRMFTLRIQLLERLGRRAEAEAWARGLEVLGQAP
jgi:hypothetical protein